MANLTKSAAKTHSEALVQVILNELAGWCIDDDIYEEEVFDTAEKEVGYYLDENKLTGQYPDEIVACAVNALSGWAIDDDLPTKTVRDANKAVAAELLR